MKFPMGRTSDQWREPDGQEVEEEGQEVISAAPTVQQSEQSTPRIAVLMAHQEFSRNLKQWSSTMAKKSKKKAKKM
jgi:hypothetical protein